MAEPIFGGGIDECAVIADAVFDLLQDQLHDLADSSLAELDEGLPPSLARSISDGDALASGAESAECDRDAIISSLADRLEDLEAESGLASLYLELIKERLGAG